MQCQRYVADGVSEVKANRAPAFLRDGGDFRDVEQLTAEKIHGADYHDRELITMLFDKIGNVVSSNCELAFARPRENERIFRIEPMMNELRFDCVGVGRKSRIVH